MLRAIIAGILIGITVFVVAYVTGVRTYGTPGETENGGFTYGRCGVEIWPSVGHFCDVD